jgi:hypothetical protein
MKPRRGEAIPDRTPDEALNPGKKVPRLRFKLGQPRSCNAVSHHGKAGSDNILQWAFRGGQIHLCQRPVYQITGDGRPACDAPRR